jgi:hypothetical protein
VPYPRGIVADKNNDIYVISRWPVRIKKFNSTGSLIMEWSKEGSGDGEFTFAEGLELDKYGNVYLGDISGHRIQKFRPIWRFIRGDANADGAIDIGDAVTILGILFAGQSVYQSLDAVDVDDDGTLTIADAISILNYLYTGGLPPKPPFPDQGEDPTLDELN